jgi:hypothetical protein
MEEGKDSRRAVRVFGVGLIGVLAAGALVAPGPAGGRGGYGPGGGYPTPTPTATATATATATVTATPTTQPTDTTAPSVNSRAGRGQTARSILKKGLVLTVQCSEDCRHVTSVFVSKKQARKLAIKKKAKRRVLVGKKTTLLKANVGRTIRVKLNKKAKQGIKRMKRKHVRKLQLTIGTSATDAANNVRRSSTTLSFKR